MRNFPITRAAVNLLLIVALAIQPVAVCMANVDCVAVCSNTTTFICQGCRCCEVEQSDDRCCCCSGPAQAEKDHKAEASCCSSEHDSSAKRDPSTADLDEAPAAAIAPGENTAGIRSICWCEQDSQPLSDSSPRRPTSENRDSLSLESSDLDEGAWNRKQLLAATQYGAEVLVPTRFSQVILCVWRL
jgi:hypothetical protein